MFKVQSTQSNVFTTDWQEVTFSNLQKDAEHSCCGTILWEGELIDIRILMGLADIPPGQYSIESPDQMAEAVEIDRIVLTGVEEQIQGELPPPTCETLSFGDLFAPASFYPFGKRGIGDVKYFFYRVGSLGDIDGDGDLDLAVLWRGSADRADESVPISGWILAANKGGGRFAQRYAEDFGDNYIPFVDGADLDGDGDLDLMLGKGLETQLLRNEDEAGWVPGKKLEGMSPMGLADADGDGDVDMWLADYREEEAAGVLFLNDGSGAFDALLRLRLDPVRPGSGPMGLVSHLYPGQVGGVLWRPSFDDPGQGYAVTYLSESGDVIQEHLATDVDLNRIHYAGDFDRDGDVDLVIGRETTRAHLDEARDRSLSILVNPGDGVLEEVPWLEGVELVWGVSFFDLNGDGLLDPMFVDSNIRHPAVIVSLGVEEGLPVQEGRYPIGGSGGQILGGDVDGDGDVDLVVLERSGYEGGGVYVLLNRLADEGTMVTEEDSGLRPAHFRLGANYPNPFNPQTWIPFEIPADSGPVNLRIYNVLGQPIRTLVAGRLAPGHHLVPWDGRDSQGQAVSAGVYLYRLHASDRQIIRKVLKIE